MVIRYSLTEENNFQPDIDALHAMDLSHVKLMWLNYPHMPSGTQANRTLLQEIIYLAKEKGVLIINDNPYSRILCEQPFSIFQLDGAKEVALELNSLSKSHNMAGWRLGWVAGECNYMDAILKVKSNVDSGMFYPLQIAAAKALRLGNDWYDALNDTYKKRQRHLFELLDWLECSYNPAQVGLFVWARIPDHAPDAMRFVDRLLYYAKVFIAPGIIFGKNGDRYVRVSLCNDEFTLSEAINRIKEFRSKKLSVLS